MVLPGVGVVGGPVDVKLTCDVTSSVSTAPDSGLIEGAGYQALTVCAAACEVRRMVADRASFRCIEEEWAAILVA